jgi:DNA invertase Pin-like site-specific DNA recombinase
VCDVPVNGPDLTIKKEDQILRIKKYAEKENIELVGIYEDDGSSMNCLNRPGVNRLLNCNEHYDLVLVERVWALSRKMKEMEPFLKVLESKRVPLVATSYLWDHVSQRVRHRYSEDMVEKCMKEARATVEAKHRKRAA